MSNRLQSIESIAQNKAAAANEPTDPVQKEYQQGKRFFESGEHGQAAVALHNALLGFEEKNDESGVANASHMLGKVCLARGENEQALNHFQRVLVICEKSYDRMSIIAVLQECVTAYKALKLYDKAIATCLDLLDHYQDNRDPQGTVATLEEMALTYQSMDEMVKAGDAYRTIASIHKNFKHDKTAADFLRKADELIGEN